jgi:hypothetical protein
MDLNKYLNKVAAQGKKPEDFPQTKPKPPSSDPLDPNQGLPVEPRGMDGTHPCGVGCGQCLWTWLDPNASCPDVGDGSGGPGSPPPNKVTIHISGSLTNPNNEMRLLFGNQPHSQGSYPNYGEASHLFIANPGDRVRVSIKSSGGSPATLEDPSPFGDWGGGDPMAIEMSSLISWPGVQETLKVNGGKAKWAGEKLNIGNFNIPGTEAILEWEIPINAEIGGSYYSILQSAEPSFGSEIFYVGSCFAQGPGCGTCHACDATMDLKMEIS